MAIDDNTSYELTGYQVKDLAQKIRAKADSASLGAAAFSNLYADLTGKPTIPTVYNGRLTIRHNGVAVGAFGANQSTDSTININTLEKVTVFLFCGYVNYALYGGRNMIYGDYVGRFYERPDDPLNTTEIDYDEVRTLIDNPDVDLEIIGFVRNDVVGRQFHQISDDSYSYSYDRESGSISIVICGVDVTEAAMTSFREQITFDYSAYSSQHRAPIADRKALTPLVIYFDSTLPVQGALNTSLPFLSLADLAVGTAVAADMNSEYVSNYMAQYVDEIDGCELEWRVVLNGNVVKSYRVGTDGFSSSTGGTKYHLYDYDHRNFVPAAISFVAQMQFINFESSWTPSSTPTPTPSSGPEVISWRTSATLATATAGTAAGLSGVDSSSTPPTTVSGFISLVEKFKTEGAIITLNDNYSTGVYISSSTRRITNIEIVSSSGGGPAIDLYFDGPGTVKKIHVATTWGNDPITVTLEA